VGAPAVPGRVSRALFRLLLSRGEALEWGRLCWVVVVVLAVVVGVLSRLEQQRGGRRGAFPRYQSFRRRPSRRSRRRRSRRRVRVGGQLAGRRLAGQERRGDGAELGQVVGAARQEHAVGNRAQPLRGRAGAQIA